MKFNLFFFSKIFLLLTSALTVAAENHPHRKLTEGFNEIGYFEGASGDKLGSAVASSRDGTVIAIASSNRGYVRVYAHNGSDWEQRGGDLIGDNGTGASIDISADGSIIAIAGNQDIADVRLFEWDGGSWNQLGNALGGESNKKKLALSDDGKTVVISYPQYGDNFGLAQVFAWNSTAWVQQGSNIEGDLLNGELGYSVTISGDGNVIAVTVPRGASDHFKVFEWDAAEEDWVQKGEDVFRNSMGSGDAISLNQDGSILSLGRSQVQPGKLMIWQFDEDTSTWNKLGNTPTRTKMGWSTAISDDGMTVLVCTSPGPSNRGCWVYHFNGDEWLQYGDTIPSLQEGDDRLGAALALSGDGSTIVIPATNFGDDNAGLVRVFRLTSPRSSGSNGDPHFSTWTNEHFEFHGQCYVVLMKDSAFADGIGFHIHLSTKLVRYWSYIKSAAIKIGNDILEVEGSSDKSDHSFRYWFNFEYQGELNSVGGFPVTASGTNTHKHFYEIDLSSRYPGQAIQIRTFKEFVAVKVVNAGAEAFGNTVGMTGDFTTGRTYARDGHTVLNDFTDLGQEWQVLPSEPKLFHAVSYPQFPENCIMPEDPRGNRRRQLAESSISVEEAEKVCATIDDELTQKDCVYDVLATQDVEMVGAF